MFRKKLSLEKVKYFVEVESGSGCKLLSKEYINSAEKLMLQCKCNNIFYVSFDNFRSRNQRQCKECSEKEQGAKIMQGRNNSNNNLSNNKELLKEWNYKKNEFPPEYYTISSGKKVWWICEKGHEWESTVANRNNGNGCPYCSGHKVGLDNNLTIKNPELASEWHSTLNGNLTPYDVTPNSKKKVWWECFKCNHIWNARIDHRNNGSGCPQCNVSKGENKISQYLINNSINFIIQKQYDNLLGLGHGLLSYDFYLPDYNLLIEYQGEQHKKYKKGFHQSKKDFEKQLEHDNRKREYAKENNKNLLEIWYYDFDNIETILEDYLLNT